MTPAKIRLYKGVKRVNGKIYGYEKSRTFPGLGLISYFKTVQIF